MRVIASIVLLLSLLRAGAASWYVDNAASGANNGTSWANAWTNTSAVVWGASGVRTNDTLYISGGTTTKTYDSVLTVSASGTAAFPITIRVGQDAGHNGQAILPAISINTRSYITINGSRSDSFIPATNVWYLTNVNVANMGIRTTRTNGLGIAVSGDGGIGAVIRYVEVGPHGTTNNVGDIHGIQFLNITTLTNSRIEYCWIHDIQNDGFNHNSTTTAPTTWDGLVIRDTAIERTGDDGAQISCSGVTLYRCKLYDHWYPLYNGHPDQVQFAGQSSKYLKVVNCILGNKANSLIIGEHLISDNGTIGPFLFAGNLFVNTRDWVWNSIQAYGATANAWRENFDISATNGFWTNLYVLNNTVYYQLTTPFQFGRAQPDGGTRSVWDLRVNGAARNNLILDSKYNAPSSFSAFSIHGDGDYAGGTNGVYYSTNDLPATHNIVAGDNTRMTYHGMQATNASLHGLNNVSTKPNVETNAYTMIPDGSDTVARNAGFNLSALTNEFPELMFDLAGTSRGSGGGWDIGAMECPSGIITNGLVLHINFDDTTADADDGYDDTSGYGHHALHFGYGNAHSASNRVPQQITWTNTINSQVHTGATFVRYQDGWDEYNASGSYLGITNRTTGKLWTMPVATIMFFGRYNAHPTNEAGYTNWNAGANRRFLGAGYGYKGAWTIGAMGNQWSEFRVYTNDSAAADAYVRWDDRFNTGTTGMIGSSTNMVHLSVTWSNGLAITYMNGVPFRTNQFLDGGIGGGAYLTNLTIRGPSGALSGMLQIGGDTHNGNPWLVTPAGVGDDGDGSFYEVTGAKQVPNHGWLGPGDMDDVRIYERVLTTNEIYQIASGTESGGGSVGGGGGGGGGSSGGGNISVRTTTARIGRIIRAP